MICINLFYFINIWIVSEYNVYLLLFEYYCNYIGVDELLIKVVYVVFFFFISNNICIRINEINCLGENW